MDQSSQNLTPYPADWSDFKIKFFEQIRHQNETPQNLQHSTAHYLKRFDRYQLKPFKASWNWSAFFTVWFCALYRENYQSLNLSFPIILLVMTLLSVSTNDFEFAIQTIYSVPFLISISLFLSALTFDLRYIEKIIKNVKLQDSPIAPQYNPIPFRLNSNKRILSIVLSIGIFVSTLFVIDLRIEAIAINNLIAGKSAEGHFDDVGYLYNRPQLKFDKDHQHHVFTAAYLGNMSAINYLKEVLKDSTFELMLSTEDKQKILKTLNEKKSS